MLKIGITGGIGSGKSTVAKIFATLAIPVYDADIAAKNLMNTNETVKSNIIKYFGEESYKNNMLNRSYLSSIVFKSKEKLQLLNSITHPVTIANANEWFQKEQAPYALKEAALIFESNSNQYLDYVIGVAAPEAIRIMRIMQRNNLSKEDVLKIMSRQMDEDEKMKRCDFIIDNSGKASVIQQVFKLHQQLLQMAGNN